jgi:hypothetical protein
MPDTKQYIVRGLIVLALLPALVWCMIAFQGAYEQRMATAAPQPVPALAFDLDFDPAPFVGTAAISEPIALGVMDLAIDLFESEGTLSATVDLDITQVFSGTPTLQGAITSSGDALTPTFRLESNRFSSVVSGREVIRSFALTGEIAEKGGLLQGIYEETIEGFTPKPIRVRGTFLLVNQNGSTTEAVVIPPQAAAAIWVVPDEPQAGQTLDIGLTVQISNTTQLFLDVPIRFFNGNPAQGGVELERGLIPLIEPNMVASSTAISWVAPAAGTVTLYATIDGDRTVAGLPVSGLTISRTLTVAPAPADTQPPIVDQLALHNGLTQTTIPTLTLTISASDPLPSSGVASILLAEYSYRNNLGWVATQVSPWLPYSTTPFTHEWVLRGPAGVTYLQAWARDAAGNISAYPLRSSINYLPAATLIAQGEGHVYRVALAGGEMLNLSLSSLSGDADLVVWAPEASQSPWLSQAEATLTDTLLLTAPVAGVYQIEVRAITETNYLLTFAGSQPVVQPVIVQQSVDNLTLVKPGVTEPLIPLASLPPDDLPSAAANDGRRIYLPMVAQ